MIPPHVYDQTLLSFLVPIRQFLDDPTVSEVMINGPDEIFIERKGKLIRTDARFDSQESLLAAIRNIGQYVGQTPSEDEPILEARLPDGSRVEAVLPPIAENGPAMAIRRFSRETLTVERLVGFGSLSQDACDALRELVTVKQNVVVAGGTGSGKTSMLNALSSFIPDDDRVVVIEDARELQLQKSHVVQLETRKADERGRGEVTTRDLFAATLRMRPDRIVIGEIRGSESLELVQAMTSGHGGCMSTVHATYPSDTLNRLETMALMSEVQLPLFALRAQVASAVDIIVQTGRLQDGSRCVSHITEVVGFDPQEGYKLKDLFLRELLGRTKEGKILSELRATGARPGCVEAIHAMGSRLPEAMYAVQENA